MLQADGRIQAFTGRDIAEAQGKIAGVLVSEFRFSQEEADEFAKAAAAQRERDDSATSDQAAKLAHAEGMAKHQADQNAALQTSIDQLTTKVTAAEKERDAAKAGRDKALSELRAAQGALETAVAERERLNSELAATKPPPPPAPAPAAAKPAPATPPETQSASETEAKQP